MKKFLSLILVAMLIATAFVICATAASSSSYWSINSACLVKSKLLDDGTVPTFKAVAGETDGLLVGLPTGAKLGDAFFQAKDDYSIKYFDKSGNEITSSSAHIGTTDIVKVYNSSNSVVAEYGIVTYGDADGDGVFDALDAYVAALCLNGFVAPEESPAVYEAVKPRVGSDNEVVDILDYQQIVNDTVKDEGQLEENLKGRKYPVDQTMGFDSVIYACDSKAKSAAVSFADNNFKKLVTLTYNNSATAPSASGIYSVKATVADSDEYLVEPGTVNLGFMVIAPKTGTGYSTIVDNANKTITIDITNPNATGADLTGYINSWVNPAYNLTVGSNKVTSSAELATAMSFTTYKYYKTASNKVTITDKTITDTADTANAMLGCYLPDDYTLWANNFATKAVNVTVADGSQSFGYSIVFRQNEAAVKELGRTLLLTKGNAARGQRGTNPPDSTGTGSISFLKEREVFCFTKTIKSSETGSYENTIRVAVGAGKIHPLLISSLGGTGLKSLLVGDNDTICFVSGSKKSALPTITSSNAMLLYDTSNSNQRYVALGSSDLTAAADTLLPLINDILGGMNISLSAVSQTSALVGKSGWCRYGCADDATGIRYTTDYYLEFTNVDSTADKHRSVNVVAVDGCTITTTYPSQNVTQVKDSDGNVTSTYYQKDRITQYEPFRVTATLKDGYKLSVTDASGKAVEYDAANDWYIMPASNVTVTAVPN